MLFRSTEKISFILCTFMHLGGYLDFNIRPLIIIIVLITPGFSSLSGYQCHCHHQRRWERTLYRNSVSCSVDKEASLPIENKCTLISFAESFSFDILSRSRQIGFPCQNLGKGQG